MFKIDRQAEHTTPIGSDAVLLRAYGSGTEVMIDRDKEVAVQGFLAARNIAAPVFARFRNGFLYAYISGTVCKTEDLLKPDISAGVAHRLAEVHAVASASALRKGLSGADPLPPDMWSQMKQWVKLLPTTTVDQINQQKFLEMEVEKSYSDLGEMGRHNLVCTHCDLVAGNIVVNSTSDPDLGGDTRAVTFIDWEYALMAPPAYEIANYFCEFAEFECDYSKLPSVQFRKEFIAHYVSSYRKFVDIATDPPDVESLFEQVDRYRGILGLHAAIWGLIQSEISQLSFDYSEYAELRLAEYFAWRGEFDSTRVLTSSPMPYRELMWARE